LMELEGVPSAGAFPVVPIENLEPPRLVGGIRLLAGAPARDVPVSLGLTPAQTRDLVVVLRGVQKRWQEGGWAVGPLGPDARARVIAILTRNQIRFLETHAPPAETDPADLVRLLEGGGRPR